MLLNVGDTLRAFDLNQMRTLRVDGRDFDSHQSRHRLRH
jgi:hypothetical protein